ncbi:MAG: YraN family protein [Pyrinomonadaceae bacterium]
MAETIKTLLEDIQLDAKTTSQIGKFGEETAASILLKNGYELVAANFKTPIGRNRRGVAVTGEIDFIALDRDTICFVEVKTRSKEDFASPLAAVDIRKQRQITRTARIYRKTFGLADMKYRYDVVSIVLNETKAPKVEIFKNFWDEQKFKKKIWIDDFQR